MAKTDLATRKEKDEKTGQQILTKTIGVQFYICPDCQRKYRNKENAELCLAIATAVELITEVYVEGQFLLVGKEIISVFGVDVNIKEIGVESRIDFRLVSSNDVDCLNRNNVKDWLKRGIRSITISEAVEMGWRAFSQSCWEKRATPKMKREYSKAINKVIAGLSEKKKQKILRQHVMFRQQT
jgi:hypothetical protein